MKDIYKCKLHKKAVRDGVNAATVIENKCSGYSELDGDLNKACRSCKGFVGNRG